ncbi:bacterial type serine tyrosine phosphatase [Cryptosporidium sp. chipmunk genotype I]|uniref:bacterial type serine tyrosine phosphatase n=1 Tax=Cryptosporidium sp. chipmunk genotype I TaxID=1280935 RepID=UPI00351A3A7D|nr:bacterial type serine tyrosine phosphatase [Cryptosporidium sp. chipmunk genotype I]
MFLPRIPYSLKPLIRIENSEEVPFEKGVQLFVEKHLEKYNLEERSWYLYGYEYYANILLGKRILLDVIPNVRDVSQFVKDVGLRRHILFRGGRPGSIEPDKIKHVIRDTLGIKTIIDLRGRLIFEDSYLTKDEILSRSVLWKYYTPIFENESIDNYVEERMGSENDNVVVDREKVSDVKTLILLNSIDYREPLKLEYENSQVVSLNNNLGNSPFCLNCVKRYRGTEFELDRKHSNGEEIMFKKRKEVMIPRMISYNYYLLKLVSPKFAEKWYINKYVDLRTMGGVYYDIAIFDSKTICRALKVITVSIPPILLHGNLGKDRVSVVIAVLLSILGVGEEFIIRDYCASESGLLSVIDVIEAEIAYFPDSVKNSNPEYIMYFLSKIKEEFGNMNAYLDLIGFDAKWRSRLCNKFKTIPDTIIN